MMIIPGYVQSIVRDCQDFEVIAIRLSSVYDKTVDETIAAMNSYASERPCSWRQINWYGINLNPYF